MNNFDEWSLNLRRAEQILVPGEVIKLQRKLVFLTLGAAVEISPGRFRKLSGVVLLTPVDTGRARSSWNVAIGYPDTSYTVAVGYFGGRSARRGSRANVRDTIVDAAGQMRRLGAYETVWITNSLPYIKVLEYGGYPTNPVRGSWDRATKKWKVKSVGGYSRQAPRGMVRLTVAGIREALAA